MSLVNNFENKGLTGLVNLGNTCFMNSAIQCLSNTLLLTDFFLTGKFKNSINRTKVESKMVIDWNNLLNGIWDENCTVSPNTFLKIFRTLVKNKEFIGFKQNDVQEFLVFFIDTLHEGLSKEVNISISGKVVNETDKMALEAMKTWKQHFKSSYSKIIELFYGQLVSTIECNDNSNISRTYDPICFFSIEIPLNINDPNIYDCFDLFTGSEEMTGDNRWKCDKTDELKDATKTIKIWSSPKILIVCFKRFHNMIKINKLINFPLENLDLRKYCIGYNRKSAIYDLYGVSNHSGGTMGGHYYAYCKNQNGNWYRYNDSSVEKIDISNIVTPEAYCLFYKKKVNN